MRRAALLFLTVLLAGCGGKPTAGTHYLDDPIERSLPGYADLVHAEFRELNGSVLLTMQFRDFQSEGETRIPEFTARFELTSALGTRELFARNKANLSRPAPHLQWVMGEVRGGQFVEQHDLCVATETSREPWRIRVDLLHNETGLQGGGTINRLSIDTGDFEGASHDKASSQDRFQVRGGANPHADCPLFVERPE